MSMQIKPPSDTVKEKNKAWWERTDLTIERKYQHNNFTQITFFHAF